MRVLMISKACVTASYRSKLYYMNQRPDIEVGLVVPDHWGTLPYEPDTFDEKLYIKKIPVPFNGRNHFHWYPGLHRAFNDFHPDLVHIDEEHYSIVTWQAARLAKSRGVPSLFFTWQNISKQYPFPFSFIEQSVFAITQGAIAGNIDAQQILREKGFRKPIDVIPQFGTDLNLFGPRDRSALKQQYHIVCPFVVGYVGRLIEDKGLLDLLQAMSPLLQADNSLGLLFVGSGPLGGKIHEWAQTQGIASQVSMLPWVRSENMGDVMNLIDVLVLPSRTTPRWKEQFGRVLTEAMASRDVVIGSSSGEIPHVIGDAGLVFPEGDAPALRAAIHRVWQDPELRAELIQKGVQRVQTHYTQDAIAEKTVRFYRSLLGGH